MIKSGFLASLFLFGNMIFILRFLFTFITYDPKKMKSSCGNIRISIFFSFSPVMSCCHNNTGVFFQKTFSHDTLYVPSFVLFISFIFNPPSSPPPHLRAPPPRPPRADSSQERQAREVSVNVSVLYCA